MTESIKFHGWKRTGAAAGGTAGTDKGRLEGQLALELTDLNDNVQLGGPVTAPFLLMGPGDVRGLLPGAIVGMAPRPGDTQAEETKLVQVELAEADLPWRYSPRVPEMGGTVVIGVNEPLKDAGLRPWIVLVVGTPSEILLEANGKVTLDGSVTSVHNLEQSARWAHVQEYKGQEIARLVSPRDLEAQTNYIAVIVPAFTAAGEPAWTPNATVRLDAYHWWTFSTGAEGDFATIAKKLLPPPPEEQAALASLGRATLTYTTNEIDEELQVRGALIFIKEGEDPTEPPLQETVQDHLEVLQMPLVDPKGRPVFGFPAYGDAWVLPAATQPSDWRNTLNSDPRYRGSAGLGLWAGIALQDAISEAASKQAGALAIAAQRIRALTIGLAASGALWKRLPSDPLHRLQIFGPSLSRMATQAALAVNLIGGGVRPMPIALFSSAARRVFRPGTARARLANLEAMLPANLLNAANKCRAVERAQAGLTHLDRLDEENSKAMDSWLDELQRAESPARAQELLRSLLERMQDGLQILAQQVQEMEQAEHLHREQGNKPRDWRILPDGEQQNFYDLPSAIRNDPNSLKPFVTHEPERPCQPVQDLSGFANLISDAIDPTSPNAIVRRRVLATITGLDPKQPLSPPELCPDLNLAAWKFFRDQAPDWLLPGAGKLPKDRVIAVQTNRLFIDAFMIGLNTQALAELRWRNIPVVTNCTPLRRFWERVVAPPERPDDIQGIDQWPTDSPLGSDQHATGEGAKTTLVIVLHTELFRRYPSTLIYLVPANTKLVNGEQKPDWTQEPIWTANHIYPTFPGTINPELYFFGFAAEPEVLDDHWLVLEEVPTGYRFASNLNFLQDAGRPGDQGENKKRITLFEHGRDGGTFAAAALSDPVRVLIAGDSLRML